MKGFVLTRQWLEKENSQDLVFWAATDDGPVQLVMESESSVFFIPEPLLDQVSSVLGNSVHWRHAKVDLKTFAFDPVIACYFASQKALNIARSRLEQVGVIPLEADVRPTDRYLMERLITGALEVEGDAVNQGNYLRYVNPRIRSAEYTPSLKVISLDIETSWTEHILYSIAVYGDHLRKVFMVGDGKPELAYLEYIADETTLIKRFLGWFAELDPDVIIGWSVVGFDLHFLQQRCESLGIDFALGRAGESVSWRTVAQGAARNYALVPGRVVLDGIELLRTATWSFESFALENVARQLLGRGKLVEDVDARAVEIQEMFHHDKAKLAEYNLEDCILVWEIFEATDLIDFAIERSHMTGLDPDRPGGSVAAFDFLYLPRLHRAGHVAPVVDDTSAVGSPGGYVLDSKPGLYSHVIVLDFKSLYPSIIRTFHVDPLAMIAGEHEPDAIPGFRGALFSRHHFILPGIIEELWALRDQAKKVGAKAMSQAIKIIMNSFYGVLGTPGCRFFDSRLASSITLRGHEILQTTRDLIEARGLTVIYGDTDSVFVLIEAARDREAADVIGNELMAYLNAWWRRHLEETLDVESCLEVEYETCFDRFLMPTVRGSEKGSKKRYAGMVVQDGATELVFKGLETVRSDWSQLAREFQQELYKRIFLDEPFEEFVRDTVEAVTLGASDEKLVLRRRLRRKLEDYQKNVPPHVRAARRAEEIRQARGLTSLYSGGGWVEYVMTVNGPEPRAYRESA
ncbi:MAG TPA: DNA polymerase II, partial [Pseudomonadales bacterium]|nr:DNA polymerase II [Pseudomonadales bacterium]